MPTQQQRSESTRERLLDAFKMIALQQGYKAATTQAVLEQTGLSKGALYHHFAGKSALAEAVYRAESHGAIIRAMNALPNNATGIEKLKLACHAWLGEVRRPEVRRIVLEIGPAMLGLKRVLEIENELSLKLFEQVLREAETYGEVALKDPALAARLVNAHVGEVALNGIENVELATVTIGPVIDAIVNSLSSNAD